MYDTYSKVYLLQKLHIKQASQRDSVIRNTTGIVEKT